MPKKDKKKPEYAIRWHFSDGETLQTIPDFKKHFARETTRMIGSDDPVLQQTGENRILELALKVADAELGLIAAKLHGRKGGSNSKRNHWAEKLAARLSIETAGASLADAWEAIPESGNPWTISEGMLECEIYREGEKIFFADADGGEDLARPLRKSSFKRYYHSRARA